MIYGLLAAIGWGTSAVAAAVAVRRTRTYIVVLLSQVLGEIVLAVLALVTHQTLAAVTEPVAFGLAGTGLIGLIGYLTFYGSFALGPAGLMSAISSTYGGVAAGLAVGLLGEHLTALGITGVALAVCGVALAAARPAGDIPDGAATGGRVTSRAAAVPLACASAIAYGVAGFLLADFTRRSGWLLSGVIAHGASVAVLLAALPLLGGRTALRGSVSILGWAAVAGIADAAGLLAYSRGAQVGQVAITAATSSIYPVIPLIVGVALLGERLAGRQLIGAGAIIVGLVLLGLA